MARDIASGDYLRNIRAVKAGQKIKLVFMGVTSETPLCLSVVKT